MSAWFILENLLNGIVDVNDVNIFLLEYLNRWRFKLFDSFKNFVDLKFFNEN